MVKVDSLARHIVHIIRLFAKAAVLQDGYNIACVSCLCKLSIVGKLVKAVLERFVALPGALV